MSINDKIRFRADIFNRQALKRTDEAWINEQLARENCRFLLYWKNKFLVDANADILFLDKSTAQRYDATSICWKYLGNVDTLDDDKHPPSQSSLFAAEITTATERTTAANWRSLRSLGLKVSDENASILAFTQGLLNWHSVNRYCSICGSRLIEKQAGHSLICSSNKCAKEVFPRTDPAIIVLVYYQDTCLLGRASHWPENTYSCLAGFVEVGEELESAVRREVFEESGLMLGKIKYRGSQPWPFPQSLMLGFLAEATSNNLTFIDGELADARWYTREQLLDAVSDKELYLSPSLSISYHLLEDWFNQQSQRSLTDILQQIQNDNCPVNE